MKATANKYSVIILLLLLFSLPELVRAQVIDDNLEPVGGIFDIYNFQFEYYSEVRRTLFNGLSDSPILRYQVMPSFTPENVLDIEFDRDENKYFLIYHISKRSIWSNYYNKRKGKVGVKKYKTEIDEKSVDKIKVLFQIAIMQTKFPVEDSQGLDGTNYYFSYIEFGMRSGTIWTPREGTKMRRLVEIGNKLVALAMSQKSKVVLEDNLLHEIDNLIDDFK